MLTLHYEKEYQTKKGFQAGQQQWMSDIIKQPAIFF